MKKLNKILLIDDDPINNYLNEVLVKKLHLTDEVQVSLNGTEAIKYIKEECKAQCPELIIVDISMPVMDGFEFLEEFEKLEVRDKEKARVIILTTSSDSKDEERARALSIHIIRKPLTKEKIEEYFRRDEPMRNFNEIYGL